MIIQVVTFDEECISVDSIIVLMFRRNVYPIADWAVDLVIHLMFDYIDVLIINLVGV